MKNIFQKKQTTQRQPQLPMIVISQENFDKLNQLVKVNNLSGRDEAITRLLEMVE